jgi:Fe-S-cluster containining protein
MAKHLGILPLEFLDRYARRDTGRWRLREMPTLRGLDCVFLRLDSTGKASCAVHAVRPSQCRTWPFWPESIQSPEAWEALGKACPGVDAAGDSRESFYPTSRIEKISREEEST